MKKSLYMWVALAAMATTPGFAQEVGKVLSSTPIVRQVAVPRQVCRTETVAVQAPKSGAGALMGAIAGGAIGNAIGDGGGRAVATMLGMVGGSALGDQIESQPAPQLQQVQRCDWQQVYENQPAGYRVVYEYAGKQYSVEWPTEPGATIPLQISPAMAVDSATAAVISTAEPVVVRQAAYTPYSTPVRIYLGPGRWPGFYGHH